MIEQIKRSSIGKFFNKKKGHATEAPKEETVDHNEVPTTTDKPADTPTGMFSINKNLELLHVIMSHMRFKNNRMRDRCDSLNHKLNNSFRTTS